MEFLSNNSFLITLFFYVISLSTFFINLVFVCNIRKKGEANIKSFVSLRKNAPPISIAELRKITEIFQTPFDEYALDPTYEPDKHEADTKEVNKEHEAIFKLLQKYVKLNLVVPVGTEHMYYAAIYRKACKLTTQGQHYWRLVKKNTI